MAATTNATARHDTVSIHHSARVHRDDSVMVCWDEFIAGPLL
ncbi:MAG TPA: hypothetical protein PKC73_08690 [Dermatophilaceae bacterium]|nr:hypothetical protein [Hoyosella subflava]HMT89698.1 hypothetical protein [Dermatophilaceae bacterium]